MEVVRIKKILAQNLLIFIGLHCVRRLLWTVTTLATLMYSPTLAKSKEKLWISTGFFLDFSISSNYSKPNLNSLVLFWNHLKSKQTLISFEDNEGTLFGPKITQDERMTGKKEKNWPRAVQVAEAYTSWVRFGCLFKNTYLET